MGGEKQERKLWEGGNLVIWWFRGSWSCICLGGSTDPACLSYCGPAVAGQPAVSYSAILRSAAAFADWVGPIGNELFQPVI